MDELQKLKHRIENCTDEMERIGLTKVYDKLLKLRYAFLHCFQAILAMFVLCGATTGAELFTALLGCFMKHYGMI